MDLDEDLVELKEEIQLGQSARAVVHPSRRDAALLKPKATCLREIAAQMLMQDGQLALLAAAKHAQDKACAVSNSNRVVVGQYECRQVALESFVLQLPTREWSRYCEVEEFDVLVSDAHCARRVCAALCDWGEQVATQAGHYARRPRRVVKVAAQHKTEKQQHQPAQSSSSSSSSKTTGSCKKKIQSAQSNGTQPTLTDRADEPRLCLASVRWRCTRLLAVRLACVGCCEFTVRQQACDELKHALARAAIAVSRRDDAVEGSSSYSPSLEECEGVLVDYGERIVRARDAQHFFPAGVTVVTTTTQPAVNCTGEEEAQTAQGQDVFGTTRDEQQRWLRTVLSRRRDARRKLWRGVDARLALAACRANRTQLGFLEIDESWRERVSDCDVELTSKTVPPPASSSSSSSSVEKRDETSHSAPSFLGCTFVADARRVLTEEARTALRCASVTPVLQAVVALDCDRGRLVTELWLESWPQCAVRAADALRERLRCCDDCKLAALEVWDALRLTRCCARRQADCDASRVDVSNVANSANSSSSSSSSSSPAAAAAAAASSEHHTDTVASDVMDRSQQGMMDRSQQGQSGGVPVVGEVCEDWCDKEQAQAAVSSYESGVVALAGFARRGARLSLRCFALGREPASQKRRAACNAALRRAVTRALAQTGRERRGRHWCSSHAFGTARDDAVDDRDVVLTAELLETVHPLSLTKVRTDDEDDSDREQGCTASPTKEAAAAAAVFFEVLLREASALDVVNARVPSTDVMDAQVLKSDCDDDKVEELSHHAGLALYAAVEAAHAACYAECVLSLVRFTSDTAAVAVSVGETTRCVARCEWSDAQELSVPVLGLWRTAFRAARDKRSRADCDSDCDCAVGDQNTNKKEPDSAERDLEDALRRCWKDSGFQTLEQRSSRQAALMVAAHVAAYDDAANARGFLARLVVSSSDTLATSATSKDPTLVSCLLDAVFPPRQTQTKLARLAPDLRERERDLRLEACDTCDLRKRGFELAHGHF